MSYLNTTKSPNKAKFPSRRAKLPKNTCKHCKKKISKENRLYFTGGLGVKKECRPCVRENARKAYLEKKKKMKEHSLW